MNQLVIRHKLACSRKKLPNPIVKMLKIKCLCTYGKSNLYVTVFA